nr:rust resistance kinase Lr10-like [Tanacetum cinerariifolium]
MVKSLNDMEREKPIRFTSQQLRKATYKFTIELGSCGFGTFYKGIFTNGTLVAVKIIKASITLPSLFIQDNLHGYIQERWSRAAIFMSNLCYSTHRDLIAVNNQDKKETYATKVTDFDLMMQVIGAFNGDLESGLDLKEVSGHHNQAEFTVRGKDPKGEVQIYTWMDATLRELTDLVSIFEHLFFNEE